MNYRGRALGCSDDSAALYFLPVRRAVGDVPRPCLSLKFSVALLCIVGVGGGDIWL